MLTLATLADSPLGVENCRLATAVLDLPSLTRLTVPDATLELHHGLIEPRAADMALATLLSETPWRQERITLWGKAVQQPRLSAWYGDAAATYTYSGLSLTPLPWSARLAALKSRVEAATGVRFNSVLLNYYRDARDGMGFHSDDEPELGPQPVIGSLSLGATRTFILRHRWRRDIDAVHIPLESGSLLVMAGDTQRCWKHGIEKQRLACAARVNLTFRQIRPRA